MNTYTTFFGCTFGIFENQKPIPIRITKKNTTQITKPYMQTSTWLTHTNSISAVLGKGHTNPSYNVSFASLVSFQSSLDIVRILDVYRQFVGNKKNPYPKENTSETPKNTLSVQLFMYQKNTKRCLRDTIFLVVCNIHISLPMDHVPLSGYCDKLEILHIPCEISIKFDSLNIFGNMDGLYTGTTFYKWI